MTSLNGGRGSGHDIIELVMGVGLVMIYIASLFRDITQSYEKYI